MNKEITKIHFLQTFIGRRREVRRLAAAMALTLALTLAGGERRVAAQSNACDITQVTNTTAGMNRVFSGGGGRLALFSSSDLTGGNPDGNDEIYLFDLATNGYTQVTNTIGFNVVGPPMISGDGTRIAFTSFADLTGGNPDANVEIFLYDTASSSFTQITNTTGSINVVPTISDDGTRVAFRSTSDLTGDNSDGNNEVFLFDTDTNSFTQITNTTGGFTDNPVISGDGMSVAFVSNRDLTAGNADANFEIFLYDMASNAFTQITETTGTFGLLLTVSINTDGTRVAFSTQLDLTGDNADGNSEIFSFDTATASLTQVTNTIGGITGPPEVSDDGTRIAFLSSLDLTGSNGDHSFEVFVHDAAINSFKQVTDTTGGGTYFDKVVIAGETQFAFAATNDLTGGNADGNFEIFLVTCALDSDGDGIPDDSDPDTVGDAIDGLPDGNFHSTGNKNAFLSRLEAIEQLIIAGDIDQAIQELQNLRRRVDGCGAAADTNDWITDCAAQIQIRALIDMLITNLSG